MVGRAKLSIGFYHQLRGGASLPDGNQLRVPMLSHGGRIYICATVQHSEGTERGVVCKSDVWREGMRNDGGIVSLERRGERWFRW